MDAIELFRQEHDLVRQVVDGSSSPGWTPHLPRALAREPTPDPRLSCRWSWIGSGRPQPLACGPVSTMC